MPRYMVQFALTSQALAALARNPEDRSKAVSGLAEKFDSRLIDFYYHFGDYDGFAIIEAPNDQAALGMVFAAHTPGHLKATKTTRLFTTQEGMDAMRKAGTVSYAGPRG